MLNEIFNAKKILEFCNYVFTFFCLNLIFLFFNIPILWFIFMVGIDKAMKFLPLFLVCLIPLMPNFTVLMYCMNKFMKDKSLSIIKDYAKGVKLNFTQSSIIWIIQLALIFIIIVNIRFFAYTSLIMTCISIGLLILMLLVTPYIYLQISQVYLRSIDIIKNSFIIAFKKPLATFTNILLLITAIILYQIAPGVAIVFIFSILAFMFVYANRYLISQVNGE